MSETPTQNNEVTLNTNNNDALDKILDEVKKTNPDAVKKIEDKFLEKKDEVFEITQKELIELKTLLNSNKQDDAENLIRKNLIEDDVTGTESSDNVSLDTLTIWTNLEQIDKVKWVIDKEVRNKLSPYKFLKESQITNISIWIAAKVFDSNKNNDVFWRLLNGDENKLEKIETTKEISQIQNILSIIPLDNGMKDILSILKKNENIKKNEDLPEEIISLLNNPEAIKNLNNKTIIANIWELTEEGLTKFLLDTNKDILSYEKKFKESNPQNLDMVGIISKIPEPMQKLTNNIFKMLMKLPFIWELLAALLGYNSAKEGQEWLWEDLKYAKATNNLISHWKNKVSNPNTINILKDKDLSWLEFKKLKPLFNTCKSAWIEYTDKKFWSNLLDWKDIDSKNLKLVELNKEFNKNKINDSDFENWKPKDSFYTKLNWIKLEEKKETAKAKIDAKWNWKTEEEKKQENKDSEAAQKAEEIGKNAAEEQETKKTITELINKIKLDKEDIGDLKSITIEELFDEDYRWTIEWKIWVYDYFKGDNNDNINKIRDYLLNIKKEDLIKIVWKEDLNNVKLWELYNEEKTA